MDKLIKLGMEIEILKRDWVFDRLAKFILGEEKECLYFDKLKPLYDEYGYKEVNDLIKEIYINEGCKVNE